MNNYLVYKLNYDIISEKAFLKRWVFKLRLITSKSEVHLRSKRKIIPQFWCGGFKGSVTKSRESLAQFA